MSLWSRFTRLIRSMFGGAIQAMEDPRLILEQNIRELNDQVPKMNENIATVKANVIMLQKEVKRAEREIQDLTSKIKAAIQADRDDIAAQYAMRIEKAKESHTRSKEQLKYASAAYDKSLQVKKAFMREKERKIDEAKEALRAHERARWQARVADTLEQFEVTGIDQTHDEMLQRINEETAQNEARMEMALDSVDSQAIQIERMPRPFARRKSCASSSSKWARPMRRLSGRRIPPSTFPKKNKHLPRRPSAGNVVEQNDRLG